MAEDNQSLRPRPLAPDTRATSVVNTTPEEYKGLITVRSAQEIQTDEDINRTIEAEPVLDALTNYLHKVWSVCRDGKTKVTTILNECKRQREGIYDPEVLQKLEQQGGSKSFTNITNRKCISAESWLNEMAGPDEPFTIEPTPIPEVNPQYMEKLAQEVAEKANEYRQGGTEMSQEEILDFSADAKAEYEKTLDELNNSASNRMMKIMKDQFFHGKWRKAFLDFIHDYVMYPAGIMKYETLKKIKPVHKQDENGNWIISTESYLQESFKRIDPYNFYPAPNIATVNDGDVCEKIAFQRKDLVALIGMEDSGYKDDAIRAVLEEFGAGGLNAWTDNTEFALTQTESDGDIEQMNRGMASLTIDGIEYHGSVQGKLLQEWGMTGIKDDLREYDIWAILIGNHVIMAQLNPDPLGRKPYQTSSYDKDPNNIWGKAICQKVRNCQYDANQARRAMMNNMSLSSGPQVVVNQAYLSATEDLTAMYPYKIWKMRGDSKSENVNAGDVFKFFQPVSNLSDMMQVTQYLSNEADEDSGIPKVAEGSISNSFNNAASTASGLSMIIDNATKQLRFIMQNIDMDVIQQQAEYLFTLNMLDPTVPNDAKGDLAIRARGILSTSIKQKLTVLRQEFLMMVIGNEQLTNLLGEKGIAELTRSVAEPLDLSEDLVPSDDDIERQQMNAQNDQQQAMAVAQSTVQLAVEKGYISNEQSLDIMKDLTSGEQQGQQQ